MGYRRISQWAEIFVTGHLLMCAYIYLSRRCIGLAQLHGPAKLLCCRKAVPSSIPTFNFTYPSLRPLPIYMTGQPVLIGGTTTFLAHGCVLEGYNVWKKLEERRLCISHGRHPLRRCLKLKPSFARLPTVLQEFSLTFGVTDGYPFLAAQSWSDTLPPPGRRVMRPSRRHLLLVFLEAKTGCGPWLSKGTLRRESVLFICSTRHDTLSDPGVETSMSCRRLYATSAICRCCAPRCAVI